MTHFSNISPLFFVSILTVMKCHRSNPAPAFDDQIPSLTRAPDGGSFPSCGAFCDYGRCWANASLEPAPCRNCLIYLLFLNSLSFHPILQTPPFISLLILSFCFCCWWKDSRRDRTSARDLHNVPVIRLISGPPNGVGSHRLMSCAWHSWLVWLPFVCLRFYYLAAADRFYL